MDRQALVEAILGYLNFSDGTPSPSFQKAVSDYYRLQTLADPPWTSLHRDLIDLAGRTTKFGSLEQARGVADFVHDSLLPGYREFHRDLLAHLDDGRLFQPFFVARCYEAALAQGGPWNDTDRLVRAALRRLNDFVGHRPVPVLERHGGIQPYEHERVRPIPLYLRGAGASVGPYESLLVQTLEILRDADESVLAAASLDVDVLDEVAVDPRAFDHAHPANLRPGYQFGEWDPHLVDAQGRYRRFVIRWMILDATLQWMRDQTDKEPADTQYEAAAALAGTMLLASGVSGWGPGAHGSDVSLATLVPIVAQYRDAFYASLLAKTSGPTGERLREQAKRFRQPFASIRTYLNHEIARQRAQQLVRERLALLYERMGQSDAGHQQALKIEVTSTRLRSTIQMLLTTARRKISSGELTDVGNVLDETVRSLHAAIECGAIVDPWNILGFQGNYLRFQAIEDSVPDSRVEILLSIVQEIFDTFAAAIREAAAQGNDALRSRLEVDMSRLADWWDKFATLEVSGIRRVSGKDSLEAARFVAKTLAQWRESGEEAGNVSFWRQRAGEFRSSQSFGLVVDALLARDDYVASMALLMQWLSEHELFPFEEGGYSFYDLALHWMTGLVEKARAGVAIESKSGGTALAPESLIEKFFAFLEANAGELWQVPALIDEGASQTGDDPESDDTFAAAYEGMTFRGSTDDGVDAPLAGPPGDEDAILELGEPVLDRLRFIGMLARLWRYAAWGPWRQGQSYLAQAPLDDWVNTLLTNRRRLSALLEEIDAYPIRLASASRDSMMEFERRSNAKDFLAAKAIGVAIETSHALRTLLALRPNAAQESGASLGLDAWEPPVIGLEAALFRGRASEVRPRLDELVRALESAPLMYSPTDKGGKSIDVCVARCVREAVRMLAVELPAIGDIEGVHNLLETILDLEHEQSLRSGQLQVSEFDPLFRMAFRSVMTRLVRRLNAWPETREDDVATAHYAGQVVTKFSPLWSRYIARVRLSELERRSHAKDWQATKRFIQTYGADLFTQAFLTDGNLRGILHQGAQSFLGRWLAEAEAEPRPRLLRDLQAREIALEDAAEEIDFIARAVLERYDIYRDYNTTTTHSDYGDKLHLLLELLRLLAEFERHRWALEPAYIAHAALVRHGRFAAAGLLRDAFQNQTKQTARQLVTRLKRTEEKCGFRLPTASALISEGFVAQLRLDEILALAEGALTKPPPAADEDFHSLAEKIEIFATHLVGSGIDVPEWLDTLESSVERLLDARSGKPMDPEDLALERPFSIEQTFEEFQKQFERFGPE